MRTRLLFAQLLVVVLLYFVQIVAINLYIKAEHDWYFSLSHVLGGLWAGLFFAWVLSWFRLSSKVWWCVLFALICGIAWEVFEVVSGTLTPNSLYYIFDTANDLVLDALGGLCAGLIAQAFRE